jgi:adenylate cyclase
MLTLRSKRKISAVLAADVAGYTHLMEMDEDETHSQLMHLRSTYLVPAVAAHGGTIVKNTGDGFLAAFDTTGEAARCAISLQQQLVDYALRFPPERRIIFRMGLNVCETIVENDDIFGDGVNIAARLHAYAEPGDIVMTSAVAEQSAGELATQATFDMGDLHLKHISRPIRAVGLRIGSAHKITAPVPLKRGDTRPSIAILPFRSQVPDAENAYFNEGIVENIIHALSGVKELLVISRATTQRYAGKTVDAKATGRELNVRYLLNGTVSRLGKQLRISTELCEAETGHVLRTDRYDGALADVFDLQEKIAAAAMKTIAPRVLAWELQRVMRKHPESLTAYDLVLQALEQLYKLDYASHSRARGLLQQAITLDPDYSSAYTYTAYWYIFRVGEGWSADPDADALEAARVARSAIDRDANDALALAIFGYIQSFLLRDYETAIVYLDRALEVSPSCANAWTMSSLARGFLGDAAVAIEHAEHGLRLSPLDAHMFWHEGALAQAYYIGGHYDAAIAWDRKAIARNPSAHFVHRRLIASLAAMGRAPDARRAAAEFLRLQPDFRLAPYARRCPFKGPILETWIERLRFAGLPD